jgi:hypothetical protein
MALPMEEFMRHPERSPRTRWTCPAALLLAVATLAGCGGSPEPYVDGRAFWSVAAADFDGDGRTDIAASYATSGIPPPHPGFVAVFLQNAAGQFTQSRAYDVGNDPFALTAGDFDGDGRTDLATDNEILATSGEGLDDVSVLLAVGAAPGAFVPAFSCSGAYVDGRPAPADPRCGGLNIPQGFDVNTVRTDLDGDGIADQAVAHRGDISQGCTAFDCEIVGSEVEVILQGASPASAGYPAQDGGFVTWVVAADMNGDRRPDLVIGQSNGLYLRLQDAQQPGRFGAAVLVSR